MFLVDIEKETIQECSILKKKKEYTTIAVGNKIFRLPSEDKTHYFCDTYEQACQLLCSGGWLVP